MRSQCKKIGFLIIYFIVIFVYCNKVHADDITFPTDSCNVSYRMHIELKKGYVSGICILEKENNIIKSSIVNEFGVSIMDFTYNITKDKVKLEYVMKTLNKWYIKRVLKNDLKKIMHLMQNGKNEYRNNKRDLYYQFILIAEPTYIESIE